MKKVKLREIIERNGKYIVFLFPDKRVTFTSKTKAETYLRHESKKLTAKVYKDLEIYRMLHNAYLDNWGVFSNSESMVIEEDLRTVLSLLERAVRRSRTAYQPGDFIAKAERFMVSILGTMRNEAKKASNTPLVYSLDTIQSFIDMPEQDPRFWSVSAQAG